MIYQGPTVPVMEALDELLLKRPSRSDACSEFCRAIEDGALLLLVDNDRVPSSSVIPSVLAAVRSFSSLERLPRPPRVNLLAVFLDRANFEAVFGFTTKAPTKRPGGAPIAADWPAIQDALRLEIFAVGLPHREGPDGWRYKADVIRWVQKKLSPDEEPSPSTLDENVGRMLREIEAEMKKPKN